MNNYLDTLRKAALIALLAGAVGSIALFFRAGRSIPPLLQVGFIIWILAPFVILAWAARASTRWSVPARAALNGVTILITLGSLAMYGELVRPPAGSPRGFNFVITAPASFLLAAIVGAVTALIARLRR